jgi:NAD-dependent dihydropyrimidine dehydrogenase PreA subunit
MMHPSSARAVGIREAGFERCGRKWPDLVCGSIAEICTRGAHDWNKSSSQFPVTIQMGQSALSTTS